MFYVVILKYSREKLVVPEKRCQKIENNRAIIFWNRKKNAVPCFDDVRQFFDEKKHQSYFGFILNEFRKFSRLLFFVHRTQK